MSKAFHIAPLVRYSDAHFRRLMHAIAPDSITYTEMTTHQELEHHSARKACPVRYDEGSVVMQLAGVDPKALAGCAELAQSWGYAGINLNVGCPSVRVMAMEAGVALMRKPDLVRSCVEAMMSATTLPVSVKTRIGVDEQDDFDFLHRFVETVSQSGCRDFIVHARKAWTHGLSPKENRNVPPLHYDRVAMLKSYFPTHRILINGGLRTWGQIEPLLSFSDGAMVGRLAIDQPWALRDLNAHFFGNRALPSRQEVLSDYLMYCKEKMAEGMALRIPLRHVLGLRSAEAGARTWRRVVQQQMQGNVLDEEALLAMLED